MDGQIHIVKWIFISPEWGIFIAYIELNQFSMEKRIFLPILLHALHKLHNLFLISSNFYLCNEKFGIRNNMNTAGLNHYYKKSQN